MNVIYKKLFLYSLSYLVLTLIWSCNNKTTNDEVSLRFVKEKKIINKNINTKLLFIHCSSFSVNDQEKFIFTENNKIFIIDYETYKTENELVVPYHPGYLYETSYFIENLNSIYALTFYRKKVYIFKDFELKDSVLLGNNKINEQLFAKNQNSAFFLINNNIFVGRLLNSDFNTPELLYQYDLKTGTGKNIYENKERFNIDAMENSLAHQYYFSNTHNPDEFIFSFSDSEDLVLYNYKIDKRTKIDAKTKHFENLVVKREANTDRRTFFVENNSYTNIYYDSINHYYYRIAKIGTKLDSVDNKDFVKKYKTYNASVIILDEDFNIMGETLLNDLCYDFRHVFINKYGLHILNVNKTMEEENQLVFDIFKPEKIE